MARVTDKIMINVSLVKVRAVLACLAEAQTEGRSSAGECRQLAVAPLIDEAGQPDASNGHLYQEGVTELDHAGETTLRIYEKEFALERAYASFSLDGDSRGTVVSLSIDFTVAPPGVVLAGWGKRLRLSLGFLGKVMLYPSMGKLLLKIVHDTLEGLKEYMEAGETVTPQAPALITKPARRMDRTHALVPHP